MVRRLIMEEQSKEAVDNGQQRTVVDDVILKLNDLAKAIDKKYRDSTGMENSFVFNKYNEKADYAECVNKLYKAITDNNFDVKVYEDIDIKDVTKKSKYTIRIVERSGCYVDIDMFEYRDVLLNHDIDTTEFVAKKIERITGFGTEVLKALSENICDYLSYVCYDKSRQAKSYLELGWDWYEGERIFKYDGIYRLNDNLMTRYVGECRAEIAKDLIPMDIEDEDLSYEKELSWTYTLSDILNNSVHASVIISSACTGIIRQLLVFTKETNINMNIVGERASGKSTICHFALSFFGNPEALEGSFSDTENAMEKIRVERPVLPYILDERMLRLSDGSENMKRKNLLLDIFREYEGKAKEKLAGAGHELSGKRTYGPIISNSVESILDLLLKETKDLGQYRRFMEFEIEPSKLFPDASFAERVEEQAYNCYGYGINRVITFILQQEDDFVQKLFDKTNRIVVQVLDEKEQKENLKGMLRPCAKRIALIVTTYEIIKRAFNQHILDYYGVPEKIITMQADSLLQLLVENTIAKMKRVTFKIDLCRNILKFVEHHKGIFYLGDKWDGNGRYIGWVEQTKSSTKIYYRKSRGFEWIFVYGDRLNDSAIMEYVDKCEKTKTNKPILKLQIDLEQLLGDVVMGDFENMASEYEGKMKLGEGRYGQRLDWIEILHDTVAGDGLEDSDKGGRT